MSAPVEKKKKKKPPRDVQPAANPGQPAGSLTTDVSPVLARIARECGVTVGDVLTAAAINRLRKPPSSYGPILDDAARQFEIDADRLHLSNLTAAQLHQLYDRRRFLVTREDASHRLYRAIYEQRLVLDDEALGLLLRIERRVDNMSEDDPAIADNWRFLTDYLTDFRRKGAVPDFSTEPEAEEPSETPEPSIDLEITARRKAG